MRFALFYLCAVPGPAPGGPAGSAEAPAGAGHGKPTGYTVFLRGTPVGREDVTVQEDATGTTITARAGWAPAQRRHAARRGEVHRRLARPSGSRSTASANGSDVTCARRSSTARRRPRAIRARRRSRRRIRSRRRRSCCRTASSRSTRRSPPPRRRVTAGAELRAYILPLAEIGVRVVSDHRAHSGRHVVPERAALRAALRQSRAATSPSASPPTTAAARSSQRPLAGHRRRARGRRVADVADAGLLEPRRRGGDHSRRRLQPRRDAHEARAAPPAQAPARQAACPPSSCWPDPASTIATASRIGMPTLGAARRRARRRRLPGRALRQARLRTERRPLRVGHDSGLRRGRPRRRALAAAAQGRRSEAHRASSATAKARGWRCWPRRARGESPRSSRSPGRRRRAPSWCSSSSSSALDQMKLTPEEREQKVALQKQIQAAVVTGKGWEGVPQDERAQADTPWFQSLLHVRSGEGHQGRAAAAALRPRRARPAGAGRARRSPGRPGAQAERLASRSSWSSCAA